MNETQAMQAGVFCYGSVWEPPEISFFPQAEGKAQRESARGGRCLRTDPEERKMPHDKHYNSARHKDWAEKVLRRAGYLCEECKRYGRKTPATTAHHIKHADAYPELRYVLTNGRALCEACHNKAHPEKGGKAWRNE